ncbi:DNA cytosine methyltransferase [Larkinella rosea]|uniref:DNA (cytosine-5-)-methyltransferase n=1 Tax=Larkinella rosea TaxID=2025312 RepID=A0A3P1C225_9BACT|nr:DNA cytosine methyltransferase [Larkinella rosea]RRB06854.1 DNA cytosine methyltransferase [Larkinella rosea]
MQNTSIITSSTDRTQIPVIDVFAGPGGLGEGFASVTCSDNSFKRRFKIALSIEKDPFAHQTLLLRTFLRQFPLNGLPDEYYDFLAGKIKSVKELFALYPTEFALAQEQAWKAILGFDRDVKGVDTSEIDERIRKAINGADKWVLIGGPPCQAYSIVGRARNKGINPKDPRVYLYREYYRILAVHRPAVFVMENVKGLLSSKVENDHIFTQIINDLENPYVAYEALDGQALSQAEHPGYKLFSLVKPSKFGNLFGRQKLDQRDFLIESEKFGIPQKRHRLIILGIRNDLVRDLEIELLQEKKAISVREAIGDLPAVRSQLSGKKGDVSDNDSNWVSSILKGINSAQLWKGVDGDTISCIKRTSEQIIIPKYNKGSNYIDFSARPTYNSEWYTDPKLIGVCNHETRSHMSEDLLRYLFAACYTQVKGRFPHLGDYPRALLPAHKNVFEAVHLGKFSDRFCVQSWDEPSRTVTSHISKDGHYYIHPDPTQCRSMTVREAARIQTFPDNYYFCGPRTAQFHQVGNAVPPFLAFQIAEIVRNLLRQITVDSVCSTGKAKESTAALQSV